jgi:cytidyltransferase-like protein
MTKSSNKLVSFSEGLSFFQKLAQEGKRIVQCHGTFDLLHPGHIYHLEEAKELGDILVVTITGEKFVNKGPGRPFFGDILRCKSLTALEFVDYVVVVPHPAAVEAIECVRPSIYCKGHEYKETSTDVTGNIEDDLRTVEKHGGEVKYVGSVVFSSSKFLNKHFDSRPEPVKQFLGKLHGEITPNEFRSQVESFSKLKCLVLGDIIFDRYTTVGVQGLTSKNRILSTKRLDEETHAGGSLATFKHIKQFCDHVRLISVAGTDSWTTSQLKNHLSEEENLILRHEKITTIIKQRFVETITPGHEMSKLFSVNYIDDEIPADLEESIINSLSRCLPDIDLVLVMDFGHGLMSKKIREYIQEKAPFMALNCQTNSNNFGFNIIDRQYQRADSFSLDRAEISLACGRKNLNYSEELEKLHSKLGASYSWLTLGEDATLGRKGSDEATSCPALENQILDTIGAGDAFCSVASLAACAGIGLNEATFLGQLAGALAVKIPGNKEPISKSALLKAGMTMLNV